MSDQTTQYGEYPPVHPAAADLPPAANGSARPTTGPGIEHADPMTPPQPTPAPAPAPAPNKNRRPLLIAAAVAALLVVGGGIGIYSAVTRQTVFEAAVEKCATRAKTQDEGHTLTLEDVGARENPGPDSFKDAQCVMKALNMPSRVEEHVGQTRALDGTQDDSWDGITARWNYHPTNGMTITFTDAK